MPASLFRGGLIHLSVRIVRVRAARRRRSLCYRCPPASCQRQAQCSKRLGDVPADGVSPVKAVCRGPWRCTPYVSCRHCGLPVVGGLDSVAR